ncbi:MAG: STAS domain-containing protein [Pseudomonadota bacterium]
MTNDTSRFALPAVVRMEDCEALSQFLKDARGAAATVDCSGVTRLGGLAAQMIIVAKRTWAADDQPLELIEADQALHALHIAPLDQEEIAA